MTRRALISERTQHVYPQPSGGQGGPGGTLPAGIIPGDLLRWTGTIWHPKSTRISVNEQYQTADGVDAAGRLNIAPAFSRAYAILVALTGVGNGKGAGGWLYLDPGQYSWRLGQVFTMGAPNNIAFFGIDGNGATIFPDFAGAGSIQVLMTVGGILGGVLRMQNINFASNNTTQLTVDIDKVLSTSTDISIELEDVGFYGLNATPSLQGVMQGVMSLGACVALWAKNVIVSGCWVSNGEQFFDLEGTATGTFIECYFSTNTYEGVALDKSAASGTVVHIQGEAPAKQVAGIVFISCQFGLNCGISVWIDTNTGAGLTTNYVLFDNCVWLQGNNAGNPIVAHDVTSIVARGCVFGSNAGPGLDVTKSTGNITNWTFEDCVWANFAFVAAHLTGVANASFIRCTGFTGVNANTVTIETGCTELLFDRCDGIPAFTLNALPKFIRMKLRGTVNTTNAGQTGTVAVIPAPQGMSVSATVNVQCRATSAPAGGAIGDTRWITIDVGAINPAGVVTAFSSNLAGANGYGSATLSGVSAGVSAGGGVLNVTVNQSAAPGNNNTWSTELEAVAA